MRTVFVHLRNAAEDQVEDFLGRAYPLQEGPPWICAVEGDPCLYIQMYRELAREAAREELAGLRKSLGDGPTVSVIAEVSGRHAGDLQVRDFVSKLLSEFEGLAKDDYTEGFWTIDEIHSERRKPSSLKHGEPIYFFSGYQRPSE